jgi:hypothetical protein
LNGSSLRSLRALRETKLLSLACFARGRRERRERKRSFLGMVFMGGFNSACSAASARTFPWFYFLFLSFHLATKARATRAAPRRISVETSGTWQLIIVPEKKSSLAKMAFPPRFVFALNASSLLFRVHPCSIQSLVSYYTPFSNFFKLFQN